jgi:hypothetical protein
MKTTWNIVDRREEKYLTEQMPSYLINNEKLKVSEKVASAFNSSFITIAECLH